MIRIFLDGTINQNEADNLINLLEPYDCEIYMPYQTDSKIDYEMIKFEHDFNCDMILYILDNTINNYDIPAKFIDDCWRACIHATTLKYVGFFFIGQCDDDMHRSLGNVFDLGIKIAPHNLCCSFFDTYEQIIDMLNKSKIIKLRSEEDESKQNENIEE